MRKHTLYIGLVVYINMVCSHARGVVWFDFFYVYQSFVKVPVSTYFLYQKITYGGSPYFWYRDNKIYYFCIFDILPLLVNITWRL